MSNQYSEWEQYRVKSPKSGNDYGEWEQYRVNKSEEPTGETQGWSGVMEDVGQSLQGFGPALNRISEELPDELYGAAGQLGLINGQDADYKRILQNMLIGVGKTGKGIHDLIPNARDYLGRKGIIDPNFLSSLQADPEFDFAAAVGRDGDRAGDNTFTAVGEFAAPGRLGSIGTRGAGFLRKSGQMSAALGQHAIGQNESPVIPALLPPALGTAGKVIGAAPAVARGVANTAGRGINNASDFVKSLSKNSVANTISNDATAIRNQYATAYNNLFNEAEGLGSQAIRVPHLQLNNFMKNAGPKFTSPVENFMNNPTIRGAHELQSDLGKFVRKMEKLDRSNNLTGSQHKAVREANLAQEQLREVLAEHLDGLSGQNLGNRYGELTNGFARDVVPYLNKNITDFQNKRLTPGNFIKALAGNDEFMLSELGQKYPGIRRSLLTSDLLKQAGNATKLGLGFKAYNSLNGE